MKRSTLWTGVALIIVLVTGLQVSVVDVTAQDDKYARQRECRRLLKDALALMQGGQYPEALEIIDSVLAVDPGHADGYYYRGLTRLHSGDSAGARQALTEGTKVAPMSSRIKLLLARLQLAVGDAAAAEALVDAVLMIKPREGEALYLRGLIEMDRGDTTAAVETFGQALEYGLAKRGN